MMLKSIQFMGLRDKKSTLLPNFAELGGINAFSGSVLSHAHLC